MKKYKKYAIFIILIMIGILVAIYGFSYAKYAYNSVWNYYLDSKGFYFNSNYLDKEPIKNVNNMWDGNSVHFNVKNNLNQSVVTDYDINYKVTCDITGDNSSLLSCNLFGTKTNEYTGVLSSVEKCINNTGDGIDVNSYDKATCELNNYEWKNKIANKDLYFDIIGSTDIKDITVTITATSITPYRKQISGTFILHRSDALTGKLDMDYNTNSSYDRLNITNSFAESKCVKLKWNSDNLRIDKGNNNVTSLYDVNGYINEIKFTIPAKDSMSYIFYKTNLNNNYSTSDFTLEETDGC